MQTVEYYSPRYGNYARSSGWKWRYIAAAAIGVVFIAPVVIPVAVVAALIWGKRAFTAPMAMMSGTSRPTRPEAGEQGGWHGWGWGCGHNNRFGKGRDPRNHWRGHPVDRPSGNEAFDAYREDTLKRLEEEQHQFEEFLARLRAAKDKSEFDTFMDEQSKRRSEEPKDEGPGLDDDGPVELKRK